MKVKLFKVFSDIGSSDYHIDVESQEFSDWEEIDQSDFYRLTSALEFENRKGNDYRIIVIAVEDKPVKVFINDYLKNIQDRAEKEKQKKKDRKEKYEQTKKERERKKLEKLLKNNPDLAASFKNA